MSASGSWTVYCGRWKLHGKRPCRWLPRTWCTFEVVRLNLVFRLTHTPNVGMWVSGRQWRGERFPPHAAAYDYERPDVKKKTATTAAGGDARHRAAVETELLSKLLPLVEHCCVTRYDDGDPREPGWITVKTMGAAWVVQVKDPDSGASFQMIAESVDKALEGAALLLACDEAPWAPDPFLKKNKGGKK